MAVCESCCLTCAWKANAARCAVGLVHEGHHLGQGRAGEENAVHAVLLHGASIRRCNRASATPEEADVARAVFVEQVEDFGEELNVSTVVTGKTDCAHVLLNGSTHDVAGGTMITQVDDF